MKNDLISIDSSNTDYNKWVVIIVNVAVSFIAGIVCLLDSDVPQCYRYLFILPFAHALVCLLTLRLSLKGLYRYDLPILIVLLLFTVRNAVTPMVMAIDIYESRLGLPSNGSDVLVGEFLYIYETAVVLLVAALWHTRKNKVRLFDRKIKDNTLFMIALFGGIAVSALSFVILPELRTQYYSIFDNFSNVVKEEVEYSGGIKRAISTASEMIFEATRLTVCTAVMVFLRKRGETTINYLLSIAIIIVNFLLMNDSNAYVIMLVLALCFTLYRLYPNYAKRTVRIGAIAGIAFFVLIYINRFSQGVYSDSLSVFLQAYFPGVGNFAGIGKISNRTMFDAAEQILIDLYSAVPFRTTLFGYDGGLDSLSTIWNAVNGVEGQILPNVAQSYYYFGYLFSPLLSVLVVIIAIVAFDRAKETENPYMYSVLIYLMIFSAATIPMYNFLIITRTLATRVAFMALFACFSPEKFDNILTSNRR